MNTPAGRRGPPMRQSRRRLHSERASGLPSPDNAESDYPVWLTAASIRQRHGEADGRELGMTIGRHVPSDRRGLDHGSIGRLPVSVLSRGFQAFKSSSASLQTASVRP